MTDIEKISKAKDIEEKLRKRYSFLLKIFVLIGVLLVIWAGVVFIAAWLLGYGYDWALFSVSEWVLIVLSIIVVLIIVELIVFFHYRSVKNKIEKPKEEYISGRRVHVFTYPPGVEGGIFSKTYIEIDDKNILRLRTLMIPPEDLWSKQNK